MKRVDRRQFIQYSGAMIGASLLPGLWANGKSIAAVGGAGGREPMDRIALYGPAAPLTIPLAVLKDQDRLRQIAHATDFKVWNNPDQLRAQVTGGQVHFAAFPTNVAANFYNRGIGLQLLNVSVWGILYLISSEPGIGSLADLKGEEIAIPFKGDMPDLVFQYLCKEQGIEPRDHFKVRYLSTPVEAAHYLVAGQIKHAILSEPAATLAIMRAKSSAKELHRVLDLQEIWGKVTGREALIPQAGIAALPSILPHRSDVIPEFQRKYSEALNWVNAHPQAAGQLGSQYIEGMQAASAAQSLQFSRLKFKSAQESREDLEFLFNALAELSPDTIGGKIPDAGFYYQGA